MCGGGIGKVFKSVTKGISSAFKGIGGILKSPLGMAVGGAALGALTGGFGLGLSALGGAAVGGAGGSLVSSMTAKQPSMPKIDMNIPDAPVPAPEAIAPTGTGALVEVGAASDDFLKAGGKRGTGKRTSSSVAGLGSGGLIL